MGSTEAEVSYFRGIRVAPHFRSRFRTRTDFKRAITELGKEPHSGIFENRDGDYGEFGLVIGDHDFGQEQRRQKQPWEKGYIVLGEYGRIDFDELVGLERFFAKQARKLLELKGRDAPVVMLDIGGMTGQSWSRLALTFETEVRDSQIAFVVSNLVYDPEKHLDDELKYKRAEVRDLLTRGRPLVHFVQADAAQLRRESITLPNGKDFRIKGNVDLLHECFALTYWSYIPEFEMLQAASLLSEYGTYIIQRGDKLTGSHRDYHLENEEDWMDANFQRNSARETAVYFTLDEIEKRFGLKRVKRVEQGEMVDTYIFHSFVFRKSSAPRIEVNRAPTEDLVALQAAYKAGKVA